MTDLTVYLCILIGGLTGGGISLLIANYIILRKTNVDFVVQFTIVQALTIFMTLGGIWLVNWLVWLRKI